ncbi:hypothetical protein [Marinobacter sp. SS21]|uniref:hypothetical protein n=1 Tax=Marinobacter sp. SS21 TaxID=2979460 RepID=UPI00232AE691|nr:hypothetical protein [Marinobacter sp. SS21]MDC0662872.1 hypothetical protein [Marinobacter sp. SS21]
MNYTTVVALSGPLLSGLGYWSGYEWLFWVGVGLSAVNLALNLLTGAMKLPILPLISILIGSVAFPPWYFGAGIGLLVWTLIEGLGDLFGHGKFEDRTNLPPIYGGNGYDADDPVVINCASMGMANMLIDRFISERHGRKNEEWCRGAEFFVQGEVAEPIRCICVEVSGQPHAKYFFDVSRPMQVTKGMLSL